MASVELSFAERARSLWLVWLSPTGAFTSARQRPRPWASLVVLCAFAVLPALAFVLSVDLEAFLLRELKQSGRLDEVPEDALSFVTGTLPTLMRVGLPAAAVASRAASILLVAALGFALLRGLTKELSFKACLTAVALGAAPLVLHDVLHAVLLLTRDVTRIDVQNPVLSNPAAWLDLDEKRPLGALLAKLDLFVLWATWLSAYGLNVVARTKSALPYLLTFGGQALLALAAVVGALASGAVS